MRVTIDSDVAAWMPALLAVWRARRGRGVPDGSVGDGGLEPGERRDLVAGIGRLSAGLTGERALAGARYLDDAQLLGAYLLFYWPVSYAQARAVLAEVPGALGEVLDLGAGPAPLALAALDAGATAARALDRSPAALAAARALAEARGRALATAAWDGARDGAPAGDYDTVVAGHLLNELYDGDVARRATLVEALLGRLRPGGRLVLIEPALRETGRALLAVRDRVVARGAVVLAPCLWRGDCPALAREGDWCHAEHEHEPPALVAELAEAARLHRDALKMSYLVLARAGTPWPWAAAAAPEELYRIVSRPLDRKGQHRFVGCGPAGRAPLVLPEKHVTEANRDFLSLARGDLVRVTGLHPRGDGLRLGPDSQVTRPAR